jgi:hypothetical protein
MNRFRLIALLLPVLLTACAALPGRYADADAVLTASGLDAQLAWLRQPLEPERSTGPLALIPDDWIRVVNSTVAETLNPGDIRDNLRERIKKDLSGRELAEVQRFYESGTGRQVVALESGKLDRQLQEPEVAESATLDALASTTGISRAVSLLAEHALGDAVDIALKQGCLGHEKTPFASLVGGVMKKAQLSALRNAVNERMRQRYAALSSAEQRDFLDFAQSRAGRKFFSARTAVMSDAAQRAGTALGTVLTPRISAVCKATG